MKSIQEQNKVKVPKPCSEDWNKMQVAAEGRNCLSCCKRVVDFSEMTQEEILQYLKERRNEKVCGRFKTSQVNTKHSIKKTQQ
jgi:hypothetical protein